MSKVSTTLGFLFGNVNERGELEEFYDKDFLKTISHEKFDKLSGLDNVLSEGYVHHAVEDNTDYSRKAEDARDYQDITEVASEEPALNSILPSADEDYDTPSDNPKPSNGPSILSSMITDQPAANGEAATTTSAAVAPSPSKPAQGRSINAKSIPEDLRKILPRNVQILFAAPHVLNKENFPADLKRICSLGQEGPILKFSELFGPLTSRGAFVPRKRSKFSHHRDMDLYEMSEQDIFEAEELTNQDSLDTSASDMDDGELKYMAQPLQATADKLNGSALRDEIFSSVEQKSWEDQIIWNGRGASTTSRKPINTKAQARFWGDIATAASTETTSAVAMEVDTVKPSESSTDNKRDSKPNATQNLAQLRNQELENGEWEKGIVWDDQEAIPLSSDLILDLNDVHVFPEDPTKRIQTSKVEIAASRAPSKGRKRKESEITEGEEKLDKFNLSNDRFYRPSARGTTVRQSLKKTLVLHSEPALELQGVKPHLNTLELQNFHKPKIAFRPDTRIRLGVARKDRDRSKLAQPGQRKAEMSQKADLSAKDGRITLMEYVEENPPLISNFGMGSKVRNYYRKKNVSENPLLRFDDGETVLLDQTDESPFLGEVEPGKVVQALDNNLFRAPIFKHVVPETDFLIIRPQGKPRAFIREIPAIYTVGQLQPKLEVPAPNSRVSNNYVKNRLQAYIYRLFMKNANATRLLRISDLVYMFPGNSEAAIRKRLKDCADFQRGGDDSGWWRVKDQSQLPSEDELRNLVTPEMVCLHESMLQGMYRLQSAGIRRYMNISPGFSSAILQIESEANEAIAAAAKRLDEELSLTPWNLTSNFISAMQGKGMLQLTGTGDPSGGRGEAFSYLRMPQKTINPEKKKKDMPKAQVSGSDADLRKLSLENARLVLLKFGVSEGEIQRLGRWERIGLVRKLSSEAAASGEGSSSKFARSSRYSVQQQQTHYKEQAQMIFDNQSRALSDPNPDLTDDEEDAEVDLDDFGQDLERLLERPKKQTQKRVVQEEEEENERKEFERFMEQEILEKKEEPKPVAPEPQAPKKVIRRTVTSTAPDGTVSTHVEIISDPKQVGEALRRQREKEKKKLLESNADTDKRDKKKIHERVKRQRKRLAEANGNAICDNCGFPLEGHDDELCTGRKDKIVLKIKTDALPERTKKKLAETSTNNSRVIQTPRPRRSGATLVTEAQKKFSKLLEEKVWGSVKNTNSAQIFFWPVNEAEAPGYYNIVKDYVDLQIIRERIRKNFYRNKQEFMADMKLLVDNCHLYNDTRNPHLPPIAQSLYDQANKSFDADTQLRELEKEIANPQSDSEESALGEEEPEEEDDDDEVIEEEDDELIDVI